MWVTGAKQPPESDFWEIGGFFAFPADYFRQFPMYAHVVKACSVFVKPPVSAVFRSFSALFRSVWWKVGWGGSRKGRKDGVYSTMRKECREMFLESAER